MSRRGRKRAGAGAQPRDGSRDGTRAGARNGTPAGGRGAAGGDRPRRAPSGADLSEELAVTLAPALADRDLPRCSIVVLNMNGRHHLEGLCESLARLDYPRERWELVLVDNASTDGSVEEVRARWPWARLVVNERNVGFSAGCNQGAAAASDADVHVFLNNDIRVEPDWLRELVSPVARGECASAAAKMYSWDGKLLNSAGGGMNFHGIGIQRGLDKLPSPEYDVPRKTLFACGGAMAMDAAVFRDLGGFDEEFFAYYEDVDLGWRSWVLGHEAWYVPTAVCYHHHSSTSRRLPKETIRLLQVRNPLLACFKNYGDEHLRRVLPAILALFVRRLWLVSGLEDDRPFRIEEATLDGGGTVRRLWDRARAAGSDTVPIKRVAAADLLGANDLLGNWAHWMERRREVQSRRARADEEIFRLFLKPLWCIEEDAGYRALQHGLETFLGLDELFAGLDVLRAEPHG